MAARTTDDELQRQRPDQAILADSYIGAFGDTLARGYGLSRSRIQVIVQAQPDIATLRQRREQHVHQLQSEQVAEWSRTHPSAPID